MESLKTKQLFEAASTGRVDSLKTLLDEDPLILDKISVDYDISDSPLHVAAMLGHTDFVKEIIRLKPQLTSELNTGQLSSPLHLASAKGHIDIARALLEVNPQSSLIRDRNGLAPVHLAAVKGRIEVLKMLLRAEPGAARLVVYRGENILHLCVKHFQSEALKLVVNTIGEPEKLLNAKDADGNTVLHLAVVDKQNEVVNFLLSLSEVVEVNATNNNGMTAVDVLIKSRRDVRDSEIETSLRNAGGLCASETGPKSSLDRLPDPIINKKKKKKPIKYQWIDNKKSALMVVASLIATMAFQVGVNPPGGVWQEDGPPIVVVGSPDDSTYSNVRQDDGPRSPENSTTTARNPYRAGHSIYAANYPGGYVIFNIVNTIGFTASLSIILLLMSGLPLRRRFFMWTLMVITWVAILALGVVYALAIYTIVPSSTQEEITVVYVVLITMVVWAVLMLLLLVSHMIRLIMKIIKRLIKACRGRPFRTISMFEFWFFLLVTLLLYV